MAETTNPGEDKAWELLALMNPGEVCRATGASYDAATGLYAIKSLGINFLVSTRDRSITSSTPGNEAVLTRLAYFFKLSALWYLVRAKDISCTGRLVKLQNVRGGDIFTKGSHTLPLDALAAKYGKNKQGFIEKGAALGGEPVRYGDVAVKLFPFPRIPVVLSLWLEDDEFPARADLLFDSTCDMQLPTDIIWSIAMLCALVMM